VQLLLHFGRIVAEVPRWGSRSRNGGCRLRGGSMGRRMPVSLRQAKGRGRECELWD